MNREKTSGEILLIFKTNLIQFIDDLMKFFPHEGTLVQAKIAIETEFPFPIQKIGTFFINILLPHKEEIFQRNEKFFLENNILPTINGVDTGTQHEGYFKQLWLSSDITTDEKETMFDWMITLTKIIEKYRDRLEKEK